MVAARLDKIDANNPVGLVDTADEAATVSEFCAMMLPGNSEPDEQAVLVEVQVTITELTALKSEDSGEKERSDDVRLRQ